MQACKEKKLMSSKCVEESFTTRGFSNWKDKKVAFAKHENSICHKEAVHSTITVPKCYSAEMLSTQHAKEKGENQHMLYKLLSNIRFLARQGVALRGKKTAILYS